MTPPGADAIVGVQGEASQTSLGWGREAAANLLLGVESPLNEAREVMNLRQASMYLGVSPDTLYRYVSEGVVPAFKLGNRWKLRKSVLDRWMESKMNAPRQAALPKPASQTRPKNPPRRASLQSQASHD